MKCAKRLLQIYKGLRSFWSLRVKLGRVVISKGLRRGECKVRAGASMWTRP